MMTQRHERVGVTEELEQVGVIVETVPRGERVHDEDVEDTY